MKLRSIFLENQTSSASQFCGYSILYNLYYIGPELGIDFKGGTSIRSKSKAEIEIAKYRNASSSLNLGDVAISEFLILHSKLIKMLLL